MATVTFDGVSKVYDNRFGAVDKRDSQIEVTEWGANRTALATSVIGETAPDIFVDHLARYPEFARSQVIRNRRWPGGAT
jgi:hypothetical protein